jgi:Holliday junction resolvasome RuvABC ATP-dependent DNA helicase subunit
MNGYTTRVVDAYVKRFETFNEIHRKTKIEKKKNQPPVLTSLPVYVKSLDEDEYKNLLIEQAVA